MSVVGRIRYLATFAAGRGALFLAPIVVANVMPVSSYGQVEWAHAAGSLLATGLAVGTSSVAPLVELGQERRTNLGSVLVHHIGVSILLFVTGLGIASFLPDQSSMALASLMGGVLVLQSLWSVLLKMRSRNEASILLDAGAFTIIAASAVFGLSVLHAVPLQAVAFGLLIYGLVLLGRTLVESRITAQHNSRHLWREALLCGAPLMVGALVSTAVTTSGRFAMGLLADAALTGEYGALMRVGALPVIAHQVVMIARFRSLYTDDVSRIAHAVERILAIVSVSALGFWLVSPLVGHLFGESFALARARHPRAFILILVHTLFWSGLALNDLLLARQGALGRALRWTIPCLVVGIGAIGVALHFAGVSLEAFAALHVLVMAAFFSVQCAVLRATGMTLRRAWILVAVVSVILGFISLLTSKGEARSGGAMACSARESG